MNTTVKRLGNGHSELGFKSFHTSQLCDHGYIILTFVCLICKMGNNNTFLILLLVKDWTQRKLYGYSKRNENSPLSYTIYKNKVKWIKDFSVRLQTIKLLEKKKHS